MNLVVHDDNGLNCINALSDALIRADGEPLNFVEEFTYLGSLVNKDNCSDLHQSKARGKPMPNSADLDLSGSQANTALQLRSGCAIAFSNQSCLYGSGCWRVAQS